MTVETTSYYESLLESSSTSTTTSTSSSTMDLDSDDFLTLLVTELEYQDPTDPVDNAEMIGQMTQYSQLEQLTELNEQMESFADSITAVTSVTGLNYIGMEVEADGYTVVKDDDDVSTLYFELEEDAAYLTCNIYDSEGNIVQTEIFSDVEAGSNSYTWDGLDYDGDEVDDGSYTILMSAEDSSGDSIDVSTTTTGTVVGLSSTDDGVVLVLEDGRTVDMLDVTYATS